MHYITKQPAMIDNNINNNFWTEGNGKDLLEWANFSNTNLDAQYDIKLFYQFDSEIDSLVSKWMEQDDFKNIMRSLHHSDIHKDLPEDYIQFKNDLSVIPSWLDEQLMVKGCELSERSGLNALLVLRNFALLSGYNFANLTKPLVATGSLEKGAVYRLYNTLSFWIEVSRSTANAQQMRLNACMRTRLIHSASRLLIKNNMPEWNEEKYGVPINHADTIATNIAFTLYFLFGLRKLNIEFSAQEEAGIFHLWKYVNYLLGVPVEMIPNDKQEALSFFLFWTKYQRQADEDSIRLAESLLNENTPISLLKLDVVKRNMGYIHKSISNYLIDQQTRKNLGIPDVRFKHIIPSILKFKNKIPIDRKTQITEGRANQISVLKDYKNNIA